MAVVLQLCTRPDDSIGTLSRHVAKALTGAGHTLYTFYLLGNGTEAESCEGEVRFLGAAADEIRHRQRGEIAQRIAEFCRQHKVDVCISHRYKPCDILTRVARQYSFACKIAVFHGLDEFQRLRRKLFAFRFLRDWQVVAVSDAVRKDLLKARCGLRPGNVHVIHNAVDMKGMAGQQMAAEEAQEALGLEQGLVVGSIGRLVPNKGYDILIRALAMQTGQSYKVMIIGDGRSKSDLEQLAATLNVGERISFLGTVPEAYRYVRAFDCFVLPSRSEGLPMALLEAIAGKVPAVGTTAGGIPEVLDDSFLFPPENETKLMEKLDWLTSMDTPARQDLAKAQFESAFANYDIHNFYRAWSSLIAQYTSAPSR